MRNELQIRWESMYRDNPLGALPWDEGGPAPELVSLIESGMVEKGAALDICSGTGNNAVYLAKQGFTCHGIDISPTAVNISKDKAAEASVSCELKTGNAIELPYADNTFTLIFDRGCFHSIEPAQRKMFVKGVHRVLKPQGKYLLHCFSAKDHSFGPPYSFSPDEIRKYFSGLFKIHHIKELERKEHADK